MGADPTAPDRPARDKPMTLALAGVGVLAAATALLPESVRPWNFAAVGALALFSAARLGFYPALAVTTLALALKDLGLYLNHAWWEPEPLAWLCFAGYAVVGRAVLRRTESPVRIGATAAAASVLFFVTSNFGSWVSQALPYGYSPAGLLDCYRAAIPFFRGTLSGDLIYTAAFFGLHAVLSRAYFPAERVAMNEVETGRR